VPLTASDATTLRGFLTGRLDQGARPATVRKERGILLSFFDWAWHDGQITGDTLLRMRAAQSPGQAAARGQPAPYRRDELRALRVELDERWPQLSRAEARPLAHDSEDHLRELLSQRSGDDMAMAGAS
jgi:hypothetical protein